ncbi:hypothetical protein FRB99_003174 [Tulasnella sp. 403]|nr:hypothetical protein FRB99_003174 [Tulasnella sp. 403]
MSRLDALLQQVLSLRRMSGSSDVEPPPVTSTADSNHDADKLPTTPPPTDDKPMCRICHEEDDAQATLISPCACRGSMRYVHPSCINRWRTSAAARKEFFECAQCGQRYEFSALWSLLVLSPVSRASVALIIYFISIFLASHLILWILPSSSAPNISADPVQFVSTLPRRIARQALDTYVWGKWVEDDKWRALFRVAGPITPTVVAARRFLVGLGFIGLVESVLFWPRYVVPACVVFTWRYQNQPEPATDADLARFFLLLFITGGIGKSVIDLAMAIRAVARYFRDIATQHVVDLGS